MPLWTIHHTPGAFSPAHKRELAARIADHYHEHAGLPRFYVITVFSETAPDDFYVGGQPCPAGVRIVIEHIARHSATASDRQRIAQWIKSIVAPCIDQQAPVHWEFHVDETSEELWMINGLVPPPPRSDAERDWAIANAALPY